jgi:hypothetical protein
MGVKERMSGNLLSLKQIEIDFHYVSVEDAIRIVESVINEARLESKQISCSFITGRGKIQKTLMDMLKNGYELEPRISIMNTGVLTVDIC